MTATRPVVIVGASLGGLRAAEALRRAGYLGPLTVFGAEMYAPYNRPPLSKDVLADIVSHDAVAFPQRVATADVEWMLGTRVEAANLAERIVTTQDGRMHPYSALVIATGLRPKRLVGAGGEGMPMLVGRHVVRTLNDAIALRSELRRGARVVVAGSGFVGCEVAATARKIGCEVTIVSPSVRPLERAIGLLLADELRARHEAQGVTFRMSRNITGLESDSASGDMRLSAVELDDGTRLGADVLVEAIGSEPATEWLDVGRTEGRDLDHSELHHIELDNTDGILTDSAMRAVTTDGGARDDTYVVGDAARFPNAMFDEVPRRIEHWNIPTDTAKRAGAVLAAWLRDDGSYAGVAAERFAPMPSFWSNQFDVSIQAYGLPSIADNARLLDGDPTTEAIVGFYRRDPDGDERMVGVVGIGMKAAMLPYRQLISDGG